MVMLFLYMLPIVGLAFLLGAIPAGSLVARLPARWGPALHFLLDAGKGAAAVVLAPLLSRAFGFPDTGDLGGAFAALAAVAGRALAAGRGLSRTAGNRGRPALATYAGAAAALWPLGAPIAGIAFALLLLVSKKPALAIPGAALALPLAWYALHPAKLPWNPAGIEAIGLVFLAGSFILLRSYRGEPGGFFPRSRAGDRSRGGAGIEGESRGVPTGGADRTGTTSATSNRTKSAHDRSAARRHAQAVQAEEAARREAAKREAFIRQVGE